MPAAEKKSKASTDVGSSTSATTSGSKPKLLAAQDPIPRKRTAPANPKGKGKNKQIEPSTEGETSDRESHRSTPDAPQPGSRPATSEVPMDISPLSPRSETVPPVTEPTADLGQHSADSPAFSHRSQTDAPEPPRESPSSVPPPGRFSEVAQSSAVPDEGLDLCPPVPPRVSSPPPSLTPSPKLPSSKAKKPTKPKSKHAPVRHLSSRTLSNLTSPSLPHGLAQTTTRVTMIRTIFHP